MYNFKLPSKLVQRGQPLPEMPEGIGMPMPAMPSMQPDQTEGVQSLLANYNQPQTANPAQSFGFYGALPSQPPMGFGMPAAQPQIGQNQPYGRMPSGPSFFTL